MSDIKQIFKKYRLIVIIAMVVIVVGLVVWMGMNNETDRWYPAVEPKPTNVPTLQEIAGQTGQKMEDMMPEPTGVVPLGGKTQNGKLIAPKPTNVPPLK